MLQPGRDLDFPKEAFRAHRGRQLGTQDLQGDLAVVLEVLGEIHDRHAAAAQLALKQVAISQCFDD